MESLSVPRPLYIVACDLPGAMDRPRQPLLLTGEGTPLLDAAGVFDEELLPALVGIRYALHLPKTRFETLDLPLAAIQETRATAAKHLILLAPTELLAIDDHLAALAQLYDLVLTICPPEALTVAQEAHSKFTFTLPPVAFDQISQASLDQHWLDLTDRWKGEWPVGAPLDPAAPRWMEVPLTGGSDLSYKRLARLMGHPHTQPEMYDDVSAGALDLLTLKTRLRALVELEDVEFDPKDLATLLPQTARKLAPSMRSQLSLAAPGVAPGYRKKMIANASRPPGDGVWDKDQEEVFSLLVAHDATATDAMGVVLPPLNDALFHGLAALEKHWVEGARPTAVKALMRKLNTAAADLWSGSLPTVLARASDIHAFTNFPLGLLTLPGDTAPLATITPIAYRPINPLTRALQVELSPDAEVLMDGKLRVLIAECIPDDDPVGAVSRRAWAFTATTLSSNDIEIDVRETLNARALREAIAEVRPSVLVISAHGFQQPDANIAGLMIGNEPVIGLELGQMPPLVILSACHTGPRGGGVVAVSDMIVASGATAVLSTLVPVDVFHNSTFTMRFLLYLAMAAAGEEPQTNVLEVWHRVQANSVIQDIAYGNDQLREWAHRKVGEKSPIEEFMSDASRGRLRRGHSYQDAETVISEIADRQGDGQKVRAWLKTPGYLPETIMYTLVGYPELIRLQPEHSED
ncbi:CHAT domain-containing protein [Microbacterium sp. S1037]|uniref:CHAT domain-containing protein n=1 Tax=Microbacterium sp. S1037 TaxID=3398227 RepID=UPI003AAD30D8